MIKVGLLTEAQKDSLIGHSWMNGVFFNPVQDCNNQWILSIQEMNGNVNPDFEWVKNLPLIDFCPMPLPMPV